MVPTYRSFLEGITFTLEKCNFQTEIDKIFHPSCLSLLTFQDFGISAGRLSALTISLWEEQTSTPEVSDLVIISILFLIRWYK